MSIQTIRVNNELLSIVNHTGLNRNSTVEVETGVSEKSFISVVSGVNIPLARAALTEYLDGRPNVSIETSVDDQAQYLVVTQPYRE